MTGEVSNGAVARVLFKEINDGDIRKFKAESNNEPTDGGGARDLRFGSYPQMKPMFEILFPSTVVRERRRKGTTVQLNILKGTFKWFDLSGVLHSMDASFEPPTTARPSEGRITKVHTYGCFDPARVPQGGEEDRIFLLLVQNDNDPAVWPHFAKETSLRGPGWDESVASRILGCMAAQRAAGQAVIGYFDLVSGESYCNGKR